MAVKGNGSQTKDGESQKEDESEKKTPKEKISKNPWNLFQQRLKGSGIGGDKKLLSALYREEQKALQTLKVVLVHVRVANDC